jgi:hypothetical protein
MVALTPERDRTSDPVHPQRHDKPPILGKTLQPGWRNVPRADGHDDGIEPSVLGHPVFGIGEHDRNPTAVPGRGQQGAGPLGHLLVDVDADDTAVRSDDLGQQGGVAPTTTDLQHAHAWTELRLFDHLSLDERRTDRGDGDAVPIRLGRYRVVGVVGGLQRSSVRDEPLPRHLSESVLHGR